ncbi:MAG: hypothetical protein H6643_05385 [Caldilineaceae bacterium]|nr:hypothetical protein [Caldilineaceae bacterium]
MLDDRAALIGAGFVAVTFWTVSLSRISYRANLFLALFPIFLLLCGAAATERPVPYIAAGALLGLMQYTYVAALCRSWPSCCSSTGGARCAGAA